jgi:alkylhydroperoxidase family enzyme
MKDRFAELTNRLKQAVLFGPGDLDPNIRQAAATSGDVPELMKKYAEKVALHAYKVTDEDVEALLQAGYSEDQIFELTVSVALGAALSRRNAGLESLRKGQSDAT